MPPFSRSPGDFWLKFKVGDLFPKDDPLARDIVRMMAADEDLTNVEGLKFMLETYEFDAKADAISRTKWNRAQLLLLRVRYGFLSNVLDEVVFKKYKKSDRPSLEDMVHTMPNKVRSAYDDLRDAIKTGGRVNEIIGRFRNLAGFHYSDHEFMKALELLANKTGEIIVNQSESAPRDVHFVIGYQVIDMIPAQQITTAEVLAIREVADKVQGLFHAFTVVLFDQYLLTKSLAGQMYRQDEQLTGLVDRLQLYEISPELRNAKVTLASGQSIDNPVELIKRFYTENGHILYDLLPVAEDNNFDPASLLSPAFFVTFNTRFDEWRELWQKRGILEEPLQKIPPGVCLADENIDWIPIKDVFGRFLDQKGFRISKVSKILHKKRPHLIPILDERIISRYYAPVIDNWLKAVNLGMSSLTESHRATMSLNDALKSEDLAVSLIKVIRQDLLKNLELLEEIQSELNPLLGLSLVRLFDLILWQNAGKSLSV
jgi:hypothetical protein